MKKTFPLHAPGKAAPRVVDAIKHDVRKYVKRERGKTLPEGFDLWEFNCRIGASAATAETILLQDAGAAIDTIVAAGATEVYIEILAAAGHRAPRAVMPGLNPAAATAPADAIAPPPPDAAQSS